jgi:uncharacterized protein (TIGR03503 family)
MRQNTRNAGQFRFNEAVASVRAIFVAGLFLLCPLNSFANNSAPATSGSQIKDIRVLIDISGSMKKTDPNNLRQPAVKLFATLLPSGVYSGVWTFGQWVNMLVPHGIADSKWKARVRELAPKINSSGLYTNIEDVLRRSTWDWKENNPAQDRTIIILSDGVVDISKNTEENSDSRTRITTEILPRLVKAGVKIHTIALSSFSDKELLQQLSAATGGIHETIETPTELDKVFMQIFDVAAPRDEVPLIDNKVKVDGSIREITFLVYRKERSSTVEIISPSGDTYKKNQLADNVTWHSEKRYVLVTIKEPQSGSWRINASSDPDNRAMIVTDLRLSLDELPSDVLRDQSIPIFAHLESEDGIIKRRDFLHFVRMSAKYPGKKNKRKSIKLKDNGKGVDNKKNDGIFSAVIKKSQTLGKNKFELSVNGTTFRRRSTQQINVVEHPVVANINLNSDNNISISIVPYLSLINPEFVQATATHTWPDKKSDEYVIHQNNSSEWAEEIFTNNISGKHKISIRVTGSDNNGNDLDFSIGESTIQIGDTTEEPENRHEEPAHDSAPAHEHEEVVDDAPESWVSVSLKVLSFNIIIILLGFAAYRLWKKYKYKLLPNPFEEMSNG